MLSEEQYRFLQENEEECWDFLKEGFGNILVFPVVKMIGFTNIGFLGVTESYEKHELTRNDLQEYFKNKIFDEEMKKLLE